VALNRTSVYVPGGSDFADLDHITDACDAINNLKANALERFRVVTKSANYLATVADEGAVLVCTSSLTLSLPAAATLGNGWHCWVRNEPSGATITITPNGSETIDGAADRTLSVRETVLLMCDGTGFRTLGALNLPEYLSKIANFTAGVDSLGVLFDCQTSLTVNVTAAATLGNGWYCWLKNTSSGTVTIDPNGSETVNGATTLALSPGASVMLVCNGASFQTVGYIPPSSIGISSTTTLTAAHAGLAISASSTITLNLTAAATLGSGWRCYVTNSGTGIVTIDPNGSEIIDGLSEIRLGPGNGCLIYSSGGVGFGTVGRKPEYVLLQDVKSASTDGGTFTSGAARTRDLNTEVSDTGNNCSLASNQFTLQPGTYRMYATAPGFQVGRHQAFLRNITDSSDVLLGTTEATAGAGSTTTRSVISGQFTITAAKVFEIQHRCSVTRSTDGFGLSTSFNTELYTQVELWKVV
jgi:hypothetical protein